MLCAVVSVPVLVSVPVRLAVGILLAGQRRAPVQQRRAAVKAAVSVSARFPSRGRRPRVVAVRILAVTERAHRSPTPGTPDRVVVVVVVVASGRRRAVPANAPAFFVAILRRRRSPLEPPLRVVLLRRAHELALVRLPVEPAARGGLEPELGGGRHVAAHVHVAARRVPAVSPPRSVVIPAVSPSPPAAAEARASSLVPAAPVIIEMVIASAARGDLVLPRASGILVSAAVVRVSYASPGSVAPAEASALSARPAIRARGRPHRRRAPREPAVHLADELHRRAILRGADGLPFARGHVEPSLLERFQEHGPVIALLVHGGCVLVERVHRDLPGEVPVQDLREQVPVREVPFRRSSRTRRG